MSNLSPSVCQGFVIANFTNLKQRDTQSDPSMSLHSDMTSAKWFVLRTSCQFRLENDLTGLIVSTERRITSLLSPKGVPQVK